MQDVFARVINGETELLQKRLDGNPGDSSLTPVLEERLSSKNEFYRLEAVFALFSIVSKYGVLCPSTAFPRAVCEQLFFVEPI